MKINISNINFIYDGEMFNSADVHFNCSINDHSININGYFRFEKDEFNGKSIEQLEEGIKQKLVDRIVNPYTPEEEEEETE